MIVEIIYSIAVSYCLSERLSHEVRSIASTKNKKNRITFTDQNMFFFKLISSLEDDFFPAKIMQGVSMITCLGKDGHKMITFNHQQKPGSK